MYCPTTQDHPGVLREQSISSDQSRPGDIYHPDFHLGRPAYFDLFVRSTTQSAVISSASSQAGVAAAVGEIAKDTQYQDIVNDNGGDFIPLVCETFGVWSPSPPPLGHIWGYSGDLTQLNVKCSIVGQTYRVKSLPLPPVAMRDLT